VDLWVGPVKSEKHCSPPGFEPCTIQPVAGSFTDHAISATTRRSINRNLNACPPPPQQSTYRTITRQTDTAVKLECLSPCSDRGTCWTPEELSFDRRQVQSCSASRAVEWPGREADSHLHLVLVGRKLELILHSPIPLHDDHSGKVVL
jgi:hypothetical protein